MHHRLFLSVIGFCCFFFLFSNLYRIFILFFCHTAKKKMFFVFGLFFCVGTDESSFTFFILLLEKCIAQFCHIRVSECSLYTPKTTCSHESKWSVTASVL